MGSTGSRSRLRKVAPDKDASEEKIQQVSQSEAQWTLPALPVTLEQQSRPLRPKRTTLPPLKQEITLSALSDPHFTGSLLPMQSNNSSIIHSHPPRRPQALQPLALQIGYTSTANQIAMGRDCRDGDVHQFSTTGQAGNSGSRAMTQGGFLEAQTALTQQTYRRRRSHLRQAREHRRHKVVYSVNVAEEANQQLVKLVSRPTQRDIFWDEVTGERLDPSCLLESNYLPPLKEERQRIHPKIHTLIMAEYGSKLDRVKGLTNWPTHWTQQTVTRLE